jgi:hypothetical protein
VLIKPTFTREKKRNAVSEPMWDVLWAAVRDLADNDFKAKLTAFVEASAARLADRG